MTVQHGDAEAAKLVSTYNQTQVSGVTQPTALNIEADNARNASSDDEQTAPSASKDSSIPSLLLDFI